MGLLSSLAGIAAPIVGNIIAPGVGGAIGGALGGLISSHDTPSSVTTTNQNKIDPRIDGMLFGSNGSQGLLGQYQGYLNQPQSQPLANYGAVAGDYLNNAGSNDLYTTRAAATNLIGGQSAPTSTAATASLPAYAVGNMVQAPSQNGINLTGSYQNLLSGGNTDALMQSLQAGNDLTSAQFQKNQTDITNNLMRNVLPGISQNAVLAGQYGGSRQGIAEGNALSDYTNQLTSANTQLSAANSANTANALAGAYQQGQDRALAATQGLGAQQYGVASQDAATKNAAEFMNVGNSYDVSKYNAGLAQQTGLANQNSQIQTNAQNNGATLGGAGLLGGLDSTAYGVANNDQNYGINRATQVNGLLAPYLGANSSSSSTQPVFQNTAGNVLGGALSGGLLSSLFNGGTTDYSKTGLATTGSAGNWNGRFDPSNLTLQVPSLPMWNG